MPAFIARIYSVEFNGASGRAALTLAQQTINRTQTLVKRNTASAADLEDAESVLRQASANVQAAAGRIGAAPLGMDQRLQFTITTRGRLTSTEEFANIILRSQTDGSLVRLSDVAKIELQAASFDTISQYKGRPVAPIGIYPAPGANAVVVANAVSERLEHLRSRFPERVSFSYIYNTAEFGSAMMGKVVITLLEAFALVALMVFAFLGRWRPTLIPLIAVPVAVTGARQRFRPVMMTSLAFIARLIAASLFGIFLIPMLYVVFQHMREGL